MCIWLGASLYQLNKMLLNIGIDLFINIVFNMFMQRNSHDTEIQADAQLIKELGGPAKVAEMLNFEKKGGVQRVSNWTARGIPYQIKVKHKEIFLSQFSAHGGVSHG
jgi:hypothetical protein